MKYLIGGKGNFYKANLHTHTTVSDGQLTPEDIKKLYQKKGYSIVAFTDHNVIVSHNDLSDGKFLAITSVEMDINEQNKDFRRVKTYHLNFYSKDKDKTVSAVFNDKAIGNSYKYVTDEMRKHTFNAEYSVKSINEIIRRMNADGFLTTYNHPVWSLQDYSYYMGLEGLWGVEVHNTGCVNVGLKDTDAPFIDLLKGNTNIIPVASDDTHIEKDLFGGFSIIEAEKLEYNEIISAMEKGDIYSSTGPLIKELSIDNGVLTLKCDPIWRVCLQTERRWAKVLQGENVTSAKFDLTEYLEYNAQYKPENIYIRITVEDGNGGKAWTRAYSEKELQ